MQSVSPRFTQRAAGQMRPISWRLMMAFTKEFNESIGLFTLDESLLDGPDVLASADSDVIQEWDKYTYVDYSHRVISMEWSNTFELPDSVSVAMADIVLDNHDGFFTPGSGSPIDGHILPRRPLRMYAGFGGEVVPVFVGLTEKLPKLDDVARTASFHCVDFLDSLFNRPLDETVMYVDQRTDEVLSELLQLIGLQPAQFDLDEGSNTIPFAYFEKGSTFGDAARKLMEAELGRLYMDELGIIRFKNRQSFSTSSVYTFNDLNTLSRDRSSQDDVVNVVEVRAKPRAVQASQPVWQSSGSVLVPAGGSVEVWADFSDPVTSVDEPTLGLDTNTSYYIANVDDDPESTEVSTGVTTTDFDLFATSAKTTVSNANPFAVYLTVIELWGTPAKIIGGEGNEIYVRIQNDASVAKYDEHLKTIDNDFLQSEGEATAIATMILFRHSEYGTTFNISVKGSPALQLDDAVTINDNATVGTYITTKHQNQIVSGRYQQRLRATYVKPLTFFTLNQSLLDGPDVLQI